jgi:hypothetical protein
MKGWKSVNEKKGVEGRICMKEEGGGTIIHGIKQCPFA